MTILAIIGAVCAIGSRPADLSGRWECVGIRYTTLEITRLQGNTYEIDAKWVGCFDSSWDWFQATNANGLVTLNKTLDEGIDYETSVLNVVTLPQGVFLVRSTQLDTFYKHLTGYMNNLWPDGASVFASCFTRVGTRSRFAKTARDVPPRDGH